MIISKLVMIETSDLSSTIPCKYVSKTSNHEKRPRTPVLVLFTSIRISTRQERVSGKYFTYFNMKMFVVGTH